MIYYHLLPHMYDTYKFFYINIIWTGILGVGKSLDSKPAHLRRPIMSHVQCR